MASERSDDQMLPAVAGATLSTFHIISHDSHRQSPPATDGYQLGVDVQLIVNIFNYLQ